VTRSIGGALLRLAIIIVAVLLPIVIGFIRFASNLPQPSADQSRTDAIVVLTGGGDRISTGLALLEAGKAERLFVSGVHPGVGVAELLKIDRTARGAPPPEPGLATRIDLGDTAGDTFGHVRQFGRDGGVDAGEPFQEHAAGDGGLSHAPCAHRIPHGRA
jgi:uncharacterized SAM-binding protein YcdF (DUF218 family)